MRGGVDDPYRWSVHVELRLPQRKSVRRRHVLRLLHVRREPSLLQRFKQSGLQQLHVVQLTQRRAMRRVRAGLPVGKPVQLWAWVVVGKHDMPSGV